MGERRIIYADHAATTPVTRAVAAAMQPYFSEQFTNPSSLYSAARKARRAVEDAREHIAQALDASKNEIFFTSCGTEADNWAVKSTALSWLASRKKGGKILVSAMEHHAVLHAAYAMVPLGFQVQELLPDGDGIIHPQTVLDAIDDETCLCAVMAANNEIGTIQPTEDIAAVLREREIPFLCDAVQAVGQIPFSLHGCGADFVAVSGHKFGAPKGIGLLYCREGSFLSPLLDGGGQERGQRSGTENVPYIVGLAQAVEDAVRLADSGRILRLRECLTEGLCALPGAVVNGTLSDGKRLPGNINVSFPGLDAEAMVVLLGLSGICCSAGSACNAGSTKPSHVLKSIGRTDSESTASLRFTLNGDNTEEDVGRIIAKVAEITGHMYAALRR